VACKIYFTPDIYMHIVFLLFVFQCFGAVEGVLPLKVILQQFQEDWFWGSGQTCSNMRKLCQISKNLNYYCSFGTVLILCLNFGDGSDGSYFTQCQRIAVQCSCYNFQLVILQQLVSE